jgi:hypothetical protein
MYYRRARAGQAIFGDADFHRAAVAQALGF